MPTLHAKIIDWSPSLPYISQVHSDVVLTNEPLMCVRIGEVLQNCLASPNLSFRSNRYRDRVNALLFFFFLLGQYNTTFCTAR